MLPVGLMPQNQQRVPPEPGHVGALQPRILARRSRASRGQLVGLEDEHGLHVQGRPGTNRSLVLEGFYSTSSSCVGEDFISVWS